MAVPGCQGPGKGRILWLPIAVRLCVEQVAHAHQCITTGRCRIFFVEQDFRMLHVEPLRSSVGPMADVHIVDAHTTNIRTDRLISVRLGFLYVAILFSCPPRLFQLRGSGFKISVCNRRRWRFVLVMVMGATHSLCRGLSLGLVLALGWALGNGRQAEAENKSEDISDSIHENRPFWIFPICANVRSNLFRIPPRPAYGR